MSMKSMPNKALGVALLKSLQGSVYRRSHLHHNHIQLTVVDAQRENNLMLSGSSKSFPKVKFSFLDLFTCLFPDQVLAIKNHVRALLD